jgi:hypothetical protein
MAPLMYAFFFIYLFLILPIRCMCRWWILQVITVNDTHTHTHIYTPTQTHTHTHRMQTHSVELLWTTDQPKVRTCSWQHTKLIQTSMPRAGFEPEIPTSERPRNHALDARSPGSAMRYDSKYYFWFPVLANWFLFPRKRRDFRRRYFELIWFDLKVSSDKFLNPTRYQWGVIINTYRSPYNDPIFVQY